MVGEHAGGVFSDSLEEDDNQEDTMVHAKRENVRGWRNGRMPVQAGGPQVVKVNDPALSRQVDRWALISTVAILAVALAWLLYLDHLSGFWLGAVVGRLLVAGVVTFVLAACVIGASGPGPKP